MARLENNGNAAIGETTIAFSARWPETNATRDVQERPIAAHVRESCAKNRVAVAV